MTHYWNIQEELIKQIEFSKIKPTVQYFETSKGFIPICLMADRKENFGSLSPFLGIDRVDTHREKLSAWLGQVNLEICEEEKNEESEFLKALDTEDVE